MRRCLASNLFRCDLVVYIYRQTKRGASDGVYVPCMNTHAR